VENGKIKKPESGEKEKEKDIKDIEDIKGEDKTEEINGN